MRAKLRKAILKMLDECPKCKGKGKRPRWIAIENGISTGRYDHDQMIDCPYCGKVRSLIKQNDGEMP